MRRKYWLLFLLFATITLVWMPRSQGLAQSIYLKDQASAITQPPLPSTTVMLTFDDGPSEYTPKVLDILKQNGIKATFFVVGNQATQRPILKRIYDDGHDIGNHTYDHADLFNQPLWRSRLELNLNRTIIMSQTHHSTRLFRPPYLGSDVLDPSANTVISNAADMGYITVGESIDTEDWKRPGTQTILANATSKPGGILLLHDGGGNRGQTVEALPGIINFYRNNGYKFMTITEALGVPRQQIMPSLSPSDKALAALALIIIKTVSFIGTFLRGFIIALIIASFSRFVFVTVAAVAQSRRRYKGKALSNLSVSILIPAYNEAEVITSCLKSVLAIRYPDFEIIVVDDGSSDNTFELASQFSDPRIRVLQKVNGGKASALNYGIAHSKHPYVVAIDADTIFQPDTITKLMRHFDNPKVGAVSGNVKVINKHRLITKLQSLEYIVGLNLERRMGDLFDCITVVPGAAGAFRRDAIKQAGGFSFDTLTEDTDLTFAIKEAGYTILYDSEAVAYTEAPATVKDLLKQRFRWTFGTMQVTWKHRRSFLNPKRGTLGLIGLPYLVFFQIVFPLFSPLFDIALIVGLIGHQYERMLLSFAVYTLLEVFTSAIALRLDHERLRSLWLLVPQRILYRQLMYYVMVRSAINVLKGQLVHWGKLKRQGTHLAKGATKSPSRRQN